MTCQKSGSTKNWEVGRRRTRHACWDRLVLVCRLPAYRTRQSRGGRGSEWSARDMYSDDHSGEGIVIGNSPLYSGWIAAILGKCTRERMQHVGLLAVQQQAGCRVAPGAWTWVPQCSVVRYQSVLDRIPLPWPSVIPDTPYGFRRWSKTQMWGLLKLPVVLQLALPSRFS